MAEVFINNSFLEDILLDKSENKDQLGVPPAEFIGFINRLEGWKTKCKNLHWSATRKNIHEYLDEFLDIIAEYQDSLAEEAMGIYGKVLPNMIVGISSMTETPKDFIGEVKRITIDFYKNLSKDDIHAGVRSECENFIHNVNKYTYLFSLGDWEFKDKE